MKENKGSQKGAHPWLLLLGAVILGASYLIGIRYIIRNIHLSENEYGETSRHYVAVIAKSTTSAFWKSVFAGANAAQSII